MNPTIMEKLGFAKEMKLVSEHKCPFCRQPIVPDLEFRDALSHREYTISGLCQKCQDRMFGKGR